MICTGFAIGIVLGTCPLAGGSVILLYLCCECQCGVAASSGVPQSDGCV